MTREATVLGGGVAAACCAEVLCHKGWRVTLRAPSRVAAPTLVLNAVTVELVGRLFGRGPSVFEGAHRLSRRVVRWGDSVPAEAGDADAFVIRGDLLAERLLASLGESRGNRPAFEAVGAGVREAEPAGGEQAKAEPTGAERAKAEAAEAELAAAEVEQAGTEPRGGWRVYAGGARASAADGPSPAAFRRYGRRRALLASVRLRADAAAETCWTEATPAGWLFLAPTGPREALLQAVLPAPEADPDEAVRRALRATKLIGGLVEEVVGRPQVFDSAPGRLQSVCGPDWIAAGSRALAYDPLCGDGTGYAIREAVLAAAVMDGVERGLPHDPCLDHYRSRLVRAFHAHLRGCQSFYAAGGFGAEWGAEMNELTEGLREVGREVAAADEFRYGLRGLDLAPLAHA